MHYSPSIQLTGSGRRTHERRQPPATDSLSAQTRQSRMDCYAHATVPKSADERSEGGCVMTPSPIVFLIDVDNTLLDNDRIQSDLKRHLSLTWGIAIISAPCSATGSSTRKIFTCCPCPHSWWTTRSPIVS